jgi:hypothetical protein
MGAAAFGRTARALAADVTAGILTREQAERKLGLRDGERLAPSGVISGYRAGRDVPRFGADENDMDYLSEGQADGRDLRRRDRARRDRR